MQPVQGAAVADAGAQQSSGIAADVSPGDCPRPVESAPEGRLAAAEGAAAIIEDGEARALCCGRFGRKAHPQGLAGRAVLAVGYIRLEACSDLAEHVLSAGRAIQSRQLGTAVGCVRLLFDRVVSAGRGPCKFEGGVVQEIRIAVLGCGGRMGRRLLAICLETQGSRLVAGTLRPNSPLIGRDLGALAGHGDIGVTATTEVAQALDNCDVAIDFTTPEAALVHARLAAQQKRALVVGTTGLEEAQLAVLRKAAEEIPLVYARNMSLGINLLALLVEQAARALGPDYDIEILEMHHRHKVDAPSGTALLLGEAAADGRGRHLREVAKEGRSGITGARPAGEIGFASLRGGDVAGDHSVIFATEGERIELGHRASNRDLFARGGVKAALWAAGQPPGLYSMREVLGL